MQLLRISLAVSVWFATSALAQSVVRTFVSTSGVDNATCSRSTPCRTFNAAIAAVDAAGEVVALDTGGYGPFTANKDVTVIGTPGIHAAIAPQSGSAVTINAAGSTVIVRGLYLNSQGASFGIDVINVDTLHVENCVIHGFSASGLLINSGTDVALKDSTLRKSGDGIVVSPDTGTARLLVYNCRIERNQEGIKAESGSRVTISDSEFFRNFRAVWNRAQNASTTVEVIVEDSVISYNTYALYAESCSGSNARTYLSNSVITGNTYAVTTDAGTCGGATASVLSRGNNTVVGNLQETFGSFTSR